MITLWQMKEAIRSLIGEVFKLIGNGTDRSRVDSRYLFGIKGLFLSAVLYDAYDISTGLMESLNYPMGHGWVVGGACEARRIWKWAFPTFGLATTTFLGQFVLALK